MHDPLHLARNLKGFGPKDWERAIDLDRMLAYRAGRL